MLYGALDNSVYTHKLVHSAVCIWGFWPEIKFDGSINPKFGGNIICFFDPTILLHTYISS